jgi:hypothetical protein
MTVCRHWGTCCCFAILAWLAILSSLLFVSWLVGWLLHERTDRRALAV